ncbi:Lead, cadmium, zinc and mercury transporting ATPase (plasmid) [Legionella adelaidensis]|uniref:P-type Zn(2+) transporter n=1 Tax=Legionella adelaidensis TaxID=45056 RepID=A0A0W0R5X7_9GAMM|nr:HAD-IC family P-type ATPase [Legionella adelaidensis]KTC66500.1 copper transporting P-type ATPase [Legionella adelaidensis]VEH85803.1 Lead, cadmium, zinc and mercury transporting ATPase [Legionella adelaidensis]
MTKYILFDDSFLVSGIMCYNGCGITIQGALGNIEELKNKHNLPLDAKLNVNSEPYSLGVHRFMISIESDSEIVLLKKEKDHLSQGFKNSLIEVGFEIFTAEQPINPNKQQYKNWVSILLNLLSMGCILALTSIFPPSFLLTLGLTTLCFSVTGFTIRHYIWHFFNNLRYRQIANMSTSITLGWFFSFLHTLYHILSMPMLMGASMTFMCFLMPIGLIIVINTMDEINRLVIEKAKNLQLQGMKSIFPEMAQEYECANLPSDLEISFQHLITSLEKQGTDIELVQVGLENIISKASFFPQNKNSLTKGTILTVKRGECFPVDCFILVGNTVVDASLLNGEPQQKKDFLAYVPAGAINLEETVQVYATANPYNSTVNKLLFRANRTPKTNEVINNNRYFYTFYTALIFIALSCVFIFPLTFGALTASLILKNLTGILFAICPCTIAIAHQLPRILALHYRNHKDIILRNESLLDEEREFHTFVFDKTGTLTTGKSKVDQMYGISPSLLSRVFLLEEKHGGEHPIARAICNYFTQQAQKPVFDDIRGVEIDAKKRGLSGVVQGQRIHIGNLEFIQSAGIEVPEHSSGLTATLATGLTPVYIAENGIFQGVILIRHEIRPGVIDSLKRLKEQGKKIILLTGDTLLSAMAFNQQNHFPFDETNINAQQTPEAKEQFLSSLMMTQPEGVCFVGDGLNDAPCSRIVSDKGGVSCAMSKKDKAAFFTDLSLNGSLDYLFQHKKINAFLKRNIKQNQFILLFGLGGILAFLGVYSAVGIGISTIISMLFMTATTLLTVLNSYRTKLFVDNALDKNQTGLKEFLASDATFTLLMSALSFLITSSLITIYISKGATILPVFATTGILATLSSVCILSALALTGIFAVCALKKCVFSQQEERKEETLSIVNTSSLSPIEPLTKSQSPRLAFEASARKSPTFFPKGFSATGHVPGNGEELRI